MRLIYLLAFSLLIANKIFSDNQTSDLSPIFDPAPLPFTVEIELVANNEGNPFLLDQGLQSYVVGLYKHYYVLLTGRKNGLHGFNFNDNPANFPPSEQNPNVYVVDIKNKQVIYRSLANPGSGLSQDQIDSLSVTDAQFYQLGDILYITGGYGFKQSINDYTTFDTLTAIQLPQLIDWVAYGSLDLPPLAIRQISDPIFKVAGGEMYQLEEHGPFYLVFGQDFEGAYFSGSSTQTYTQQVRRFEIIDDLANLQIRKLLSSNPDPSFRRRDLNIIPTVKKFGKAKKEYGIIALSGVFTETDGVWTVPVLISSNGLPSMEDPNDPLTFKQGFNNYFCPIIPLYSKNTNDYYLISMGGLSYQFFENGALHQDTEIPFNNQVTTIKWANDGSFTQYLMNATYPYLVSTQSHPGKQLLFGTGAYFVPAPNLNKYLYITEIFKLDKIKEKMLLGYIFGGIQSTLPNTETMSDSAASPYIFRVTLTPRQPGVPFLVPL